MSAQAKVLNPDAGIIKVKPGRNPRSLYPHQLEAIKELADMEKRPEFSSLLVLPTGAGKTMTAVQWLLNAALDNKKKVLWLAHRHLLLEQAADALSFNAFSPAIPNRDSFSYRIISGRHNRPVHISPTDDVLIASKDSGVRNLEALDEWMDGEDEIYVVVDEAHHAPARSYRRILEHVKARVPNVKLLGLTATPFRTSPQEKGLLGQIFVDDVVYKTDLLTLVKKGILSTPIYESADTKIDFGNTLGINAVRNIERLDVIPADVAEEIAANSSRNRLIVERYLENSERYGQTLVFALNRTHAFALKALFEQMGREKNIKAGVIVSGTRAEFTGIDISAEENERQIRAYQNGDLQVLINVNILTEGVDLPKTETVFLTRPTISTVLMTQMIGRALRAEKAGGTKNAHIVSFLDDWQSKVAWVNPETVIVEEENAFPENDPDYVKRQMRLVSIEKLEEFARIVNESVDTTRLEAIDFIKRVPVGMYVFTFVDESGMEHNHQILVYDQSEQSYRDMIEALPAMFAELGLDEEEIPPETLKYLVDQCKFAYFSENVLPPLQSAGPGIPAEVLRAERIRATVHTF